MALIKIGGSSRNRVVLLTVSMVALAGLLVSVASYVRTRSLAASYDRAMETELHQKGLAYGQTAQSLLNAVAAASPAGFQALLGRAATKPETLISQFNPSDNQFQDVPLSFQVWAENPSAPGSYEYIFRSDLPAGRTRASNEPGIPAVIAETSRTSQTATGLDTKEKELYYSFVISPPEEGRLIVVATLDASQEFAFIETQQEHALRDAIIFSASSVAFVALVGGLLSFFVSRTLTNRKRAEEALRDGELRYRTLANVSPVGIFRTDSERRCIYANDRGAEILGLPREQVLGHGWVQSIHPDDRERLLAEWSESAERGETLRSEYRLMRPDGTVVWVLGQITAERTTHGEIVGYVGTATDITEHKQMEETLRDEARRDRLTGLLNHAAVVEELQQLVSSGDHER